ncbi:hypothetical protein CRENPOLYSF1_340024 [Crenothrix polyspora]|uniref:Uncharacterized protein n=1 Tax=Crenothrix polyspora TaxID=360316 RepID=A0A1R4H9D8_9GAMM|nr:hypothetical protein CRENPOLYSF1_340024 [Crenothrix polyspora]
MSPRQVRYQAALRSDRMNMMFMILLRRPHNNNETDHYTTVGLWMTQYLIE